jgi:hypothetical protein
MPCGKLTVRKFSAWNLLTWREAEMRQRRALCHVEEQEGLPQHLSLIWRALRRKSER